MDLRSVLEGIKAEEIAGDTGRDISAVIYDSRQAAPGCLFAALKGERADGSAFIDIVAGKGAAAVMHQGWDGNRRPGVAYIKVPDARQSLALAAANFYGRPSDRLQLAGITGTNGKTTTSYLIKAVLERLGGVGLLGTISYRLGDEVIPAPNTTPESVDLQRLLARMVEKDARYAVLEVSSHSVVQHRVGGCGFAVKVFTNFTQDHLDYHGTMEQYYAAKKSLFTDYAGANVINIDDPRGADLAKSATGEVLTYGIEGDADIRAREITSTAGGLEFLISSPAGDMRIRSRLVGRHNIYNVLAAAGACIAMGVSPSDIELGLTDMGEVPGRLEKVDAGQDFTVLVDYAHTEDALERVLATAREFTRGRLITVFGCGGDRDRTKRPKMGTAAARLSDVVIVTSDNPRTEDPAAIMKEVEAGVEAEGSKKKGADYFAFTDRGEAIEAAIGRAAAGDTVFIAGKGHEDYQIIGTTKFHFDDREAARKAIMGRASSGALAGRKAV